MINIAIDGPAGAGKSTIARKVAEQLSYIYVDTGAMYRAMALYLHRKGLDAEDEEMIAKVCGDAQISIEFQNGEQAVILEGENVNPYLRTQEVSEMASRSSAVKEVREHLVELQRKLAREKNVVMDGRDIGTVVLPAAQVKIYLTASVGVRAKRRFMELKEKGETVSFEEIAEEISQRDHRDMTRKVSPLRKAEDAVLVDSSDMSIDEVTACILQIIEEKTAIG